MDFEEAMATIEDDSLESFKTIWNAACEDCARRADDCMERQLGHEFREYVKVK